MQKNTSYDDMSINSFITDLASENPTPGGGAATAILGEKAYALIHKVTLILINKSTNIDTIKELEGYKRSSMEMINNFKDLMKKDVEAYDGVVKYYKTPKVQRTDEMKSKVFESAADVSLRMMNNCLSGIRMLCTLKDQCKTSLLADVAVAAEMLGTVCQSNMINVISNANSLPKDKRNDYINTAHLIQMDVVSKANNIYNSVLNITLGRRKMYGI